MQDEWNEMQGVRRTDDAELMNSLDSDALVV